MEECDCQKSCVVNGSVHADGASWQRDCDICSCVVSLAARSIGKLMSELNLIILKTLNINKI